MATQVFIDTEFTDLPWKPHSELISIGLCTNSHIQYYACNADVDHTKMSPFVKQNIFPYLEFTQYKKTKRDIAEDIHQLLNEEDELIFWAIFPTIDQLKKLNDSALSPQQIFDQYADWDYQLLKNLFAQRPPNFPSNCSNLTEILQDIPPHLIPKNEQAHNALSDALWNYKIWKLAKKLSLIQD